MDLLFKTPELIQWGGIAIVLLLVFAETGLLLGLVIPGGETLIFTAGLFVSTGTLRINIFVFLALLIIVGLLGDSSGYYIGRKYGRKLYTKRDTWYFKKRYLQMTNDYFNRHKKASVTGGKFLPVIRPFIPVLCGITKMETRVFLSLSFVSAALYMSAFVMTGYVLGNKFPEIKNYLGFILPASVLFLLIPVLIQLAKHKKEVKKE